MIPAHRLAVPALCLLLVNASLAGCGGGPQEQAMAQFMASREALAAGDVVAFRGLVAAEHAAQFEGPQAAFAMEMAQSMMPQDLRLLDASFSESTGTLRLAGRNIIEGGERKLAVPAEGTVQMVRESGAWKIAKEDWSMQLDRATPIFDVQPFVQEGQRLAALKRLEGHASGATQIAHTPDWEILVTASYGDFSLRTWDVASGAPRDARTLEDRPTGLALGADGETLLTASVAGDVLRWPLDAAGGLGEPEVLLHEAGQSIALSPDDEWLAVTSYDAPVVVYDMTSMTPAQRFAGSEKLRSVSFSPAGDLLAGSEGNQLLIWDTRDWTAESYTLDEVSPDSSNAPVAFSPDGRYLGIACGDSSIIVFDAERRRVEHDFFVSGVAALAIQFSPDAGVFATAQNNQQINVWSTADHRRVAYVLAKKANATALRFSPDGRYLVAGHDDRDIVFWGVAREGEPAVALEPAAGGQAPAPAAARPERVSLLGRTNYLDNPSADQQQQFWRSSGDARVEECAPLDPCFVTRWDGQLVGSAELPADAAGKAMLLIGTASAERVRARADDQTGEAYIHGYGESLEPSRVRGRHYGAHTLQTQTRRPGQWSTIWGVFEVGEGIRKIHFEIRQSDGRSPKDGSATRFDDLGVYLFDSPAEAEAFVARYEAKVGRVAAAARAEQPAASPAPAASGPTASPASPGSAITSCNIGGRIVFTTRAQCAQAGGR